VNSVLIFVPADVVVIECGDCCGSEWRDISSRLPRQINTTIPNGRRDVLLVPQVSVNSDHRVESSRRGTNEFTVLLPQDLLPARQAFVSSRYFLKSRGMHSSRRRALAHYRFAR